MEGEGSGKREHFVNSNSKVWNGREVDNGEHLSNSLRALEAIWRLFGGRLEAVWRPKKPIGGH